MARIQSAERCGEVIHAEWVEQLVEELVAKQEPAAPTVARGRQLQFRGDEAVGRVQPVVHAEVGRMGAELDSVRG